MSDGRDISPRNVPIMLVTKLIIGNRRWAVLTEQQSATLIPMACLNFLNSTRKNKEVRVELAPYGKSLFEALVLRFKLLKNELS